MSEMKKPLNVQYGTIYTEGGIGIDNMSVILDKTVGLMKYGDKEWIEEYFDEMVAKYRTAGFENMADNLMVVHFDRYDGSLDIEAICTFVNYMILCSGNIHKIMSMFGMTQEHLLEEIKKLKEFGY